MKELAVSEAIESFDQVMEEVNEFKEPVRIKGHNGHSVIVISESEYRNLQETMLVYSNKSVKKSIIDAKQTSTKDCIEYKKGKEW